MLVPTGLSAFARFGPSAIPLLALATALSAAAPALATLSVPAVHVFVLAHLSRVGLAATPLAVPRTGVSTARTVLTVLTLLTLLTVLALLTLLTVLTTSMLSTTPISLTAPTVLASLLPVGLLVLGVAVADVLVFV